MTEQNAKVVHLSPRVALAIISDRGCSSSTYGLGSCWSIGRDPLSPYGADQVCDGCLAWAALRDIDGSGAS